MSSLQLQEFQKRCISAENTIKALQKQLNDLSSSKNSNNQNKRPYSSSSANQLNESKSNDKEWPNSIQPDETYPVWHTPYDQSQIANKDNNIMVINSLTGPNTKVPFIPKNGRLVKWYTCGPTVYAPSHMGHARTYITFDIIRNILEYYFSYRVNLVMNITDVDDKIILRARQNYLFEQYKNEFIKDSNKVRSDIDTAFKLNLSKREKAVSGAEATMKKAEKKHKKDMQENLMGQRVKLENVQKAYQKYQNALQNNKKSMDELLEIAKSALSEWLDAAKGDTVTDQAIFRRHAEHFEQEFFEDMRRLNIRDPDVLTRVTEYVPEIIEFVQKIIANGYAYEANGSVYFNTEQYIKNHDYPKLDPKKLDNKLLMDEGEGSLASKNIDAERNSHRDFALWKKSKSGEPRWKSPWGDGRPGWHIECSAMASQVHGDNMDIHTGGEDLKFPHHDNEMAQSCAFYSDPKCGCYHKQWVNYWFHAGHLHISGLKMSKSLKNFVSIRQALERCSARTIRLLFLLQSWHGKMNYSDDIIEETQVKEHQLHEFFLLISALNRKYNSSATVASTPYMPSNKDDYALNEQIMDKQLSVDKALRDNFDYVKATQLLFELIGDINTYIKKIGGNVPNILLLNKSASFVNDMLKIFGVISQNETYFVGAKQIENESYLQSVLDVITLYRADLVCLFRTKSEWKSYNGVFEKYTKEVQRVKNEKINEKKSNDEISVRLHALIKELVTFDENICKLVKSSDKNAAKQLIKMTDALRDGILPKYGVKIEDIEGGNGSIWKLYEPKVLLKMLHETKGAKNNQKIQNKINQIEKNLENWRKKSIAPEVMFKDSDYKLDDNGKPTHDANGKELSKSQMKKVTKAINKQAKAYEQYQKKLKANPSFMTDMEKELEELKSQLM